MSAKNEYALKRVEYSILPELLPLYKDVFNQDLPLEFLQGKFKCNANGKDTLAYIAVANDGTVAAYYNVLPYMINYKNKEMLAVQSCVAMTHAAHRGKGLFPLLGKAVHDLARDEGARFIFGFPNPQSYHGLVNKMGFSHFDTMKSYRIRVPAIPIGKLLKKFGMMESQIGRLSPRLKKLESTEKKFINSVIDDETGGVVRNENFINYKSYSGCLLIEIKGVKVWVKQSHILTIGDMERVDERKFAEVLNVLKKIASRLFISDILFAVAPGTYYDMLMQKMAIPFTETLAILYWDFNSGLDLKKIRFTGSDYDTF